MSAELGAPCWVRDPAVLWRRVGASLVLLAPGANEALEVSGSAVEVWDFLSRPAALDDLVAEVARAYRVEEGRIAGDVRRLVDDLVTRRILLEAVPAR